MCSRSAAYDASVTVLPCAHADLIALGVCQDPECSRMVVADEPTAGREGGFDSGNGIVVRNSQRAPAARRAVPALADSAQDRDALREFVRRREVDRQELGGMAGLLGSSGAAACP